MVNVDAFDWPQWLYLAWFVFGLLTIIAYDGEYLQVKGATSTVIKFAVLFVLICGGFFK